MQKTTVRGNNVDILELLFTSSVQCSNLYGNLNKRRVFSRSKMFIQNIIILLQIFRIQLWISICCKDRSVFFYLEAGIHLYNGMRVDCKNIFFCIDSHIVDMDTEDDIVFQYIRLHMDMKDPKNELAVLGNWEYMGSI